MSFETIIVEETEGLLKIRLNRPDSYNAINLKMIDELHEVFLGAEKNSSIRAVFLTGVGKAFCSGGDVKGFFQAFQNQVAQSLFHHMPTRLHDMMLTMKQLDKPILGAINGPAVGAGFSIAAACDLLVAAESAYFSLAYLKIGLSPDGGSTFFLPRSLGAHKTFELLTLGERVKAAEAKTLGLVAKVFPDASFETEALEVARHLASLPTQAVAVGKRLIFESLNHPIEAQLNRETQGVKQTAFSQDFFEGVSAFVQKRPPQFKGE
jgi:2-(1,2-epoxy-1,2-dihydrophenyl)acetyl-CoA isomerase